MNKNIKKLLESEDEVKIEIKYELIGNIVITNWYGYQSLISLDITTDEKGLKEIEQNPLQDFTGYGAQSVDYAYFDVYKIEIEHHKDYTKEIRYNEPIKTIEAGDIDNEKLKELLKTSPLDFIKITY